MPRQVTHTEKQIEQRLKDQVAKKLGGKVVKMQTDHMSGLPDRLLLLPGGRAVFVEVKREGEKMSILQTHKAVELRKLGFPVHVVDSYESIDK